ncbi:membrane lipoprotein lipid attachment site-containing protein [Pseudotamlana carrageenivorans]|uniref:Uncharacterized protein n=1 Tax=Pseudotamlana carrageenivorans TaxID=2069432 RepID=A0A2I7SFT8_9FLAO|nr:membrane lipoprotein lipid attachment site-containing protein [Tamlana carrageenivorans]AUS04730.1 hypothetical protein C1A40_04225 [Tamlana carrageenivorans]
MKKILFLLVAVGAMLAGCNPMEDVYKELDKVENPIVGSSEYTLQDDDYSAMGLSFSSFDTEDQAKEEIPGFLETLYPFWGNGSQALITYNLYKSNSIKSTDAYEVTDQDYQDLGFSYGNFSSPGDMADFLVYKFPNAVRGDVVDLTYKYYSGGSTSELTNNFVLLEGWEMVREFTADEYMDMEQSYPNFSNEDVAENNISIYLKSLYPYASSGERIVTMYELFINGEPKEMKLIPFVYDGANWNAISSVIESTLQFGHDGNTWVPDNTIKYALLRSDYDYMSAQLASEPGFEGPASSMGNYGNFDRREGNANYWSLDMIEQALIILLDNMDPNAEEGQKYIMTYDIYNGTNTTEDMFMIKKDGVWQKNI